MCPFPSFFTHHFTHAHILLFSKRDIIIFLSAYHSSAQNHQKSNTQEVMGEKRKKAHIQYGDMALRCFRAWPRDSARDCVPAAGAGAGAAAATTTAALGSGRGAAVHEHTRESSAPVTTKLLQSAAQRTRSLWPAPAGILAAAGAVATRGTTSGPRRTKRPSAPVSVVATRRFAPVARSRLSATTWFIGVPSGLSSRSLGSP